jgi:hypothetical protein
MELLKERERQRQKERQRPTKIDRGKNEVEEREREGEIVAEGSERDCWSWVSSETHFSVQVLCISCQVYH